VEIIVAYSFVPVSDEAAGQEFAGAMARRSRAVETFPGFVRFEFRRELGRTSRYVIATWWESRDDLRRYLASPAHRSTHQKLSEPARAGLGPARVEIQEVLEVNG
jgi:heme-degrading monooxygenase HmoA